MAELQRTIQPVQKKAVSEQEQKNDSSTMEGVITKGLLIIIMLLLLSLPVMIIKFNIAGMGEKARPALQDILYVNKILPAKPDPNDPKYMSKAELTQRYASLKADYDHLVQENEQSKQELAQLQDIKDNNQALTAAQQKLNDDNAQLEEAKKQLEADKQQFYEDIKNQKKTDFKAYFEKIDKSKADELYAEILQEEKADQQVKDYVSYYEKMDADSAAPRLEQMSNTQMDLVVKIFKNMNKDQAAAILGAMKTDAAAKIGIGLAKEYNF